VLRRRLAVTLRETFGANVRHYRLARNLKQHELAEAIDRSDGMVSKLERGETAPSFDTIAKIAAALDVPEVVLFATTPMSVPTGERGKLLQRIHVQLAKLNNAELARAVKMLKALE
jgi:transcriptional regulator with XRE-family HTH domain